MSEDVKPGTITAERLSSLTGMTDRQHRNIAKLGYFAPPYRGRYDFQKTIQGLFRYKDELNKKKTDGVKDAEQRLKTAKADMAEEELAEFRGEYILKRLTGPALRNVSLHQRATLQRKLECELAPQLAGKTTQEILERMRKAVDEICDVFQEGTRAWMDGPAE